MTGRVEGMLTAVFKASWASGLYPTASISSLSVFPDQNAPPTMKNWRSLIALESTRGLLRLLVWDELMAIGDEMLDTRRMAFGQIYATIWCRDAPPKWWWHGTQMHTSMRLEGPVLRVVYILINMYPASDDRWSVEDALDNSKLFWMRTLRLVTAYKTIRGRFGIEDRGWSTTG
jgi:hypothetical protein